MEFVATVATAFKKSEMQTSIEKRLERNLYEAVKRRGGLALKFWPISYTGFPDRMLLLPSGRIWFVELKDPTKTLSPRQKVVHGILGKLGFVVPLINSDESLKSLIDEL